MDADVQRDLDSLWTTDALPQGMQPRFALTPHHQRGIVSRYLLGVGLGGFLTWLLALVIALVIIEGTGQDGAAAEKVIPSLMVAALVGFGGFIIPGLLIGAWLWIRESRARIREATAETYRMYWVARERATAALAHGQATPDQVAHMLARFHTDSMNEDGQWVNSSTSAPPLGDQAEVLHAVPGPAAESGPRPSPPPRPSRHASQWFGEQGQSVTLRAWVEGVHPIQHESRIRPHFLYIVRTHEGDLLRWMASRDAGLETGDDITLQGTVKGHSTFNDERQTEVFYCQPTIHNADR